MITIIIAVLILGLGLDVLMSWNKGAKEARRIQLLCAPLEVQRAEEARRKHNRNVKLIAGAILIILWLTHGSLW
jgi:hypothetical protein